MVTSTLEANLLEKLYIYADKITNSYVFLWKNKWVTLPRAQRAIESFNHHKSKIMNMFEAKKKAIELSRKTKGKIYINVDDKGVCSTDKKFLDGSSVFCYKNGSEIALDSYTNITPKTENLNTMSTVKKNEKVAAKGKISGKAATAKTADRKPTRKLPAGAKELTGKEIIALLKKGKEVVTVGKGNPFTIPYLEKGDLNSVRACVVK